MPRQIIELPLYLLSELCAGLRILVQWLVVAFFVYMGIAVLVQVFGRYIFNYSISGAAESATFAQVWMIFLASGLAMKDRLHVSVDVLQDLLPAPMLRFLTIVIAIPCIWFLWQAIVGSLALIDIGTIQSSPVLQLPMWIPYLSLPVGLSYLGLEFILFLAARWDDPKGLAGNGRTPVS